MREKQILLTTSDNSGILVVTNANTVDNGTNPDWAELIEAGDGQSSAEWSRQLAEDFLNPKIGFALDTNFLDFLSQSTHLSVIVYVGFSVQFCPVILRFLVEPIFSFCPIN